MVCPNCGSQDADCVFYNDDDEDSQNHTGTYECPDCGYEWEE